MAKIKIFDMPWHIGHQYEMLKFPFAEFDWLFQWIRDYNEMPRGDIKHLFNWVDHYEEGKYDVAILHLDQGCIDEGTLSVGKGSIYRHLNSVIKDIPKIVIMHGTPYYPEVEEFKNTQVIIDKVKQIVGENYMVVNSHRAREQWGWGKTIIHGMDPAEWYDLPKEPRVVTMISPGGFPAYYDRTFLEYVVEGLRDHDISHAHITVDFMAKDWEDYRNFLGRSMIYFNPTRESPMPRARTEAMLSGCCVITTPHQDADRFIKHGVNGFLVPRNAEHVVKLIEQLLEDPELAQAVGQQGKKTAIELFDWKRYSQEWQDYLNFVIKDFKQKNARRV